MPNTNDVSFNKPLVLGAVATLQKADSFSALKSAPLVLADSITGSYKYWNLKDLLRFEVAERNPGTAFKRIGTGLVPKSYLCKDYGLEEALPIEHVGELGGNPMQAIADKLMIQGMMNYEQAFAAKAFATTGGFNEVITVSTKWSAIDSNPIKDIEAGLDAIEDKTGLRPNVITCTRDVFRALKQNQDILDRLATDQLRILRTEQALAVIFDVMEFNVSKASRIVGNEQTTEVIGAFASKKLVATYKAPTAPEASPNGLIIIARNYAGEVVGANGMGVETYFEKNTDSNIIRLKQRFTVEIPSADLGVVFDACIA